MATGVLKKWKRNKQIEWRKWVSNSSLVSNSGGPALQKTIAPPENPPASQTFQLRFWLQESRFSCQSYSLLLHHFFITFLFPSTLAPHHERLTLYTITMIAR
jgi:hypothetical protein